MRSNRIWPSMIHVSLNSYFSLPFKEEWDWVTKRGSNCIPLRTPSLPVQSILSYWNQCNPKSRNFQCISQIPQWIVSLSSLFPAWGRSMTWQSSFSSSLPIDRSSLLPQVNEAINPFEFHLSVPDFYSIISHVPFEMHYSHLVPLAFISISLSR